MTLIEARRISEINEMVEDNYKERLKEAENYYNENIIDMLEDEDQLVLRQLGLIDYVRELKPEFNDKSDEEVLEHINNLEIKYGDD